MDNQYTNRIPTLPFQKMVEEDGNPTPIELMFRQNLVTSLQAYMGDEGMVIPSQTASDILVIQNNVDSNGEYTCAPGTFIYNTTNDTVMVSVLVGGIPVFKTVTVT